LTYQGEANVREQNVLFSEHSVHKQWLRDRKHRSSVALRRAAVDRQHFTVTV